MRTLARLMLMRTSMSRNTARPWARALMWLVILVVPGGLLLFALLRVDVVQRRLRGRPAVAEADVSESGTAKRLGSTVDQRV